MVEIKAPQIARMFVKVRLIENRFVSTTLYPSQYRKTLTIVRPPTTDWRGFSLKVVRLS